MNKQPVDIHEKQYNRNLLVLVLIIGSFCTVLNGTLLSTALPSIMRDFKISTATAEWLSTAFLLVNGVMIPISAWLINRFGSRKMYLSAMSTFFIGTVIAAIAPNFQTLLAGRIIQGLGVGVTMPLLQTIMLSIFPANKRGAAMGTVGIVIGLAPAIGPTLSGWVVDNLSWRYLFSIIAPIAGIVVILAAFLVKDVLPTKDEKRIKNVKINKLTLPLLQGNLLLSKNHMKTKIIPKKVSKPSKNKIVSTKAWIFSKKPNNT